MDAAFEGASNSRHIATFNILGGWVHRVVRQTIEDTNRGELTELSQLEPRFRELEQKVQDLKSYCEKHAPPLPKDIYDEAYAALPVQLKTTFDTVSDCPSVLPSKLTDSRRSLPSAHYASTSTPPSCPSSAASSRSEESSTCNSPRGRFSTSCAIDGAGPMLSPTAISLPPSWPGRW